jgi:hypothetical protein
MLFHKEDKMKDHLESIPASANAAVQRALRELIRVKALKE